MGLSPSDVSDVFFLGTLLTAAVVFLAALAALNVAGLNPAGYAWALLFLVGDVGVVGYYAHKASRGRGA